MKLAVAVGMMMVMLYGRAEAGTDIVDQLRGVRLACSAWSFVCYNWTYSGVGKTCNYGRWECTRR